MKKRCLSLFLTLAMCLSLGTFALPQQAKADDYGTFYTSENSYYYIWLKDGAGDDNYRWNANGTEWQKTIHLDIPAGADCAFHFTDAGDGYYGIKCRGGSYYIDTDNNNNKENQVLHQYHSDLKQDNQKFKFIPVEGQADTYRIQIKNSGLYVGLKDNAAPARFLDLVTASEANACEWIVVPTVPPLRTTPSSRAPWTTRATPRTGPSPS